MKKISEKLAKVLAKVFNFLLVITILVSFYHFYYCYPELGAMVVGKLLAWFLYGLAQKIHRKFNRQKSPPSQKPKKPTLPRDAKGRFIKRPK